ncbi:2-keto-3-deoxy-L-rhamnonate aldolase RhmA [Mycoplana sp. BE70]|uniref:HpcH/HpaI aldolase family protein n=1 Tax=Mycoplana sp. BE70 TaxID=2817775 RepID=UPI002862F8EA|nr:aldolase/citrate lyase family protein [Mycoplana sp. BE70]MDR6756428.1 2-keto-3-deoxy-L-rhamnonate aldolase RhmA [Mycoplana sp. BE70]
MSTELLALTRNAFKEKMAQGEVVSSMTVRLVRSVEIVTLAKTAGFDAIYVDMEHSSFDFNETAQICMMALASGVAPFVRVPANRPEYIARALDGGAMGIIAPDVHSAEEAREVVAAAKFPTLGTRGFSGSLPHTAFRSFKARDLVGALNDSTMVIVQFESGEAVRRADEIAAVEGVDMVLIGTNDLMADLGIAGDFDSPLVEDAYRQTIDACRRHGKQTGVGGLSSRPDLVERYIRMGARYVSTGTDINFLLGAATQRARQVADIRL